jgi:hypothetical protein
MDDDYGYFGKGITGYVHYNEAMKNSGGGGGGGGGSRGGCLTVMIISVVLVIGVLVFLL